MDGRFFEMNVFPTARPQVRVGPVKVIAQMSEPFLNRCLQAWLVAHRGQLTWSDPTRTTRFELTRIEAGLLQSKPNQLKFFGKLRGELFLNGRKLAAALGDWEALLALSLVHGQVSLKVLPDTLKVNLTDPLRLPVPPGWAAGLQTLLASKFGTGVTLPVPLAYAEQLSAAGIRATDPLGSGPWPRGIGARGMLVVAGPPTDATTGPDLLERRLGSHEFALCLSTQAVNAALDQNLGRILPLRRPVPPELAGLASEVVLRRLAMRYDQSQFRILEAEVVLVGAFPDEEGARLMGSAEVVSGRGGLLKLKPHIESVVFVSRLLNEMDPDVQELIRHQTRAALSSLELDFLLPNKLMIRELARQLELMDVQAGADELRFLGRLSG